MERRLTWLVAAAACGLLIAGCGSGAARTGATGHGSSSRAVGLDCPNGLEDVQSGILDYGAEVYARHGHSTPREALAAFAADELPAVPAEDFEREPAEQRHHVRFVYERDGARLADLSANGYRGGWFVTGYKACEGQLADGSSGA